MIVCGDNRTGSQCSNATTPWYYEGRYKHMAGVYVEGAYWRYGYHHSSYWRYYHGRVQHKTAHWELYADQPRLKVWINFFGDYTITGYWNDHEYD